MCIRDSLWCSFFIRFWQKYIVSIFFFYLFLLVKNDSLGFNNRQMFTLGKINVPQVLPVGVLVSWQNDFILYFNFKAYNVNVKQIQFKILQRTWPIRLKMRKCILTVFVSQFMSFKFYSTQVTKFSHQLSGMMCNVFIRFSSMKFLQSF